MHDFAVPDNDEMHVFAVFSARAHRASIANVWEGKERQQKQGAKKGRWAP
jgi:hypothetical protein